MAFATNTDSPRVQAALKKQRRAVLISSAVLTALPLLGFLIYGAVSDSMELGQALLFGLIISTIFALSSAISLLKQRLAKPFAGTVADKRHIYRAGSVERGGGGSRHRWRIWIDCDDGRRRRKDVRQSVFDYLEIGERVRFLPQFPQPMEKYDKSRDAEIPCMFCARMNPAENEDCAFCHYPLIK